jgi:hypothetical protein
VLAYPRKLPYAALAAVTVAVVIPSARSRAVSPDTTQADTTTADTTKDQAPDTTLPAPPPAPDEAASETPAPGATDNHASDDACLARTICAVKERIRWQTPAWTPSQCKRIADAVAKSADDHHLSPTLLLAIMVNESDMNEKAARIYTRAGKVYAKDGGLMAIRCIVDQHDRCTNGNVRGMPWKDLMNPVNNIELGARELAHYRDGGGVMRKTIVKRDAAGHLQRVVKEVACDHKNHAYWAHYNHGPRYIDHGYPRHYPHRIAVLDHAFAEVMNAKAPELAVAHVTIHDAGKRERTPDRPIEARYKKLTSQILSSGTCSAVALN